LLSACSLLGATADTCSQNERSVCVAYHTLCTFCTHATRHWNMQQAKQTSTCLSLYRSVCLPLGPSLHLSFYLYLSLFPFVGPFVLFWLRGQPSMAILMIIKLSPWVFRTATKRGDNYEMRVELFWPGSRLAHNLTSYLSLTSPPCHLFLHVC